MGKLPIDVCPKCGSDVEVIEYSAEFWGMMNCKPIDRQTEYHKLQAALSVAIADHIKTESGKIIGVVNRDEFYQKLLVIAGEK